MGQVVSRESQGSQETLFRCIRSMPSDPDRAYNSCYSAGENYGVSRGLMWAEQVTATQAELTWCGELQWSIGSLGVEANPKIKEQDA